MPTPLIPWLNEQASRCAVGEPVIVFVACIQHIYGTNFYVAVDEPGLTRQIDAYVQRWSKPGTPVENYFLVNPDESLTQASVSLDAATNTPDELIAWLKNSAENGKTELTLFTACIQHPWGANMHVATSQEQLESQIAAYVRRWSVHGKTADAYFESTPGEDCFQGEALLSASSARP